MREDNHMPDLVNLPAIAFSLTMPKVPSPLIGVTFTITP